MNRLPLDGLATRSFPAYPFPRGFRGQGAPLLCGPVWPRPCGTGKGWGRGVQLSTL